MSGYHLPPLPVALRPTKDMRLQQFEDFLYNFATQHRDDPRFQVPGHPDLLRIDLIGTDEGGGRKPTVWIRLPSTGA